MTQAELDLLHGYLSRTLSGEEFALLQTLLRENSDARRTLRALSTVEVKLQQLAATNPATLRLLGDPIATPLRVSPRPAWSSSLFRRPLVAAALVLVSVAVAGAWNYFGSSESQVLTLVDASGSVAWSHGGVWRTEVGIGKSMSAGTLETVGESATAQLQFRDGTIISLTGESELSFSEDGQKLLVLRKGSLSAQVKAQPKGKPMLVRTPSAEAEVVGTVFNLAARADDTLLKVDEGLVKLKRLADGSAIDVPAKSSALASLDSTLKLNSATTPAALATWSFDFTSTVPPHDWRGIWHDASDGGRMVASPYVASRSAEDSIITHFGVSVRTSMLNPPLALIATDTSIVRYRLRQDQLSRLQVMLLTNVPKGAYGGNFECVIAANELRPDADGWCDIEIPVSRFKPADLRRNIQERYPTPVGHILTAVLLSSFQKDTKLTVARFELKSSR
jgi:ferric-dicitrate binding protein FerR (iron transport regulator)